MPSWPGASPSGGYGNGVNRRANNPQTVFSGGSDVQKPNAFCEFDYLSGTSYAFHPMSRQKMMARWKPKT